MASHVFSQHLRCFDGPGGSDWNSWPPKPSPPIAHPEDRTDLELWIAVVCHTFRFGAATQLLSIKARLRSLASRCKLSYKLHGRRMSKLIGIGKFIWCELAWRAQRLGEYKCTPNFCCMCVRCTIHIVFLKSKSGELPKDVQKATYLLGKTLFWCHCDGIDQY